MPSHSRLGKNSSASPVTVRNVALPKLVRLRMTKAFLVPILHKTLIGEGYWPPKARAWEQRRPADGGVITAGPDPQSRIRADDDYQPGWLLLRSFDHLLGTAGP